MKSRNSFRYNGLIHKRTVGIETTKDNKGLVLTTRNPRGRCEEPVVRVTCVLTRVTDNGPLFVKQFSFSKVGLELIFIVQNIGFGRNYLTL